MNVFRPGIPLCLLVALSVTACGLFSLGRRKAVDRIPNPLPEIRKVAVAPVLATESFPGSDLKRFGRTLAAELQHHEGFVVITPQQVANFVKSSGKTYKLPEQARELAVDMKVDAILVAVINQFHPYEDPRVGLCVMMFFSKARSFSPLDITALERSGVEMKLRIEDIGSVVSVIEVVDASRRETRKALNKFAERQAVGDERPLGDRAYLVIMANYEEFVCYAMVQKFLGLIQSELDKANAEREARVKRAREKEKGRRKKGPVYEWR